MSRRTTAFAALLAALVLTAAACADKTTRTEPGPDTQPTFSTITAGTLTIGSDIPYAPFEFNDDKTKALTGFDVELLDAVAKYMGLKTKWVDALFDTIFTELAAGKFDAVASAVTAYAPAGSPAEKTVQERLQRVSFSLAYYDSLQSLAVDPAKTPNIKTVDDLKSGDKVAVQSGTTGESWAKSTLGSKGVQIVGFSKAPEMFQALETARVVAVVNDLPVSLDAVKTKPKLKVVQQISTGEQYGFAVRKDNPALLTALNEALRRAFKDGTYARLFKKYFPEQDLPSFAK